MIPMVDARSGKVVKLGEKVTITSSIYNSMTGKSTPTQEAFQVEAIDVGVFSAKARVRTWSYLDGKERVAVVPVPIRYFPKLIYGPEFPVGGLRVAILPS
jgi:hypothetical protein